MQIPAADRERLASFGYRIVSWLGSGQEATVYRARDAHGADFVVKLFDPLSCAVLNHGGHVGRALQPIAPTAHLLRRLSRRLQAPTAGLTPFSLLERQHELIGLAYRFEPLLQLRRVLLAAPAVRRTYLATFAAAQAWLIRETALASCEPQFMIAHDGTLRFIEYGPMLLELSDVRCRDERYLSRTFFRLLTSLYRPRDSAAADWQLLRPAVAADAVRAAELIDQVADGPEAGFSDSTWYAALAAACCARIPAPLVLAARVLHRPRSTRKH